MREGYYVSIHTPASGASYAAGSRLIITGIAGYWDASVPMFRGARRVLIQLVDDAGAVLFHADSELNQLNFNRILQFFSTQTTLPAISGTTPRRFTLQMTATYDVVGGRAYDFVRKAEIDVHPPASVGGTWSPAAAPPGPLAFTLDRPAPGEPVDAGGEFLVRGHSSYVDDESFLFLSLIDSKRHLIVDDVLITSWYRIDANMFRASLTAPTVPFGSTPGHVILVQAIHKIFSTLTASASFEIKVRTSAPSLARAANPTATSAALAPLPVPPAEPALSQQPGASGGATRTIKTTKRSTGKSSK